MAVHLTLVAARYFFAAVVVAVGVARAVALALEAAVGAAKVGRAKEATVAAPARQDGAFGGAASASDLSWSSGRTKSSADLVLGPALGSLELALQRSSEGFLVAARCGGVRGEAGTRGSGVNGLLLPVGDKGIVDWLGAGLCRALDTDD